MHYKKKFIAHIICAAFSTVLLSCKFVQENKSADVADSSSMQTAKHEGTYLTDIPFAIAQHHFVRNETSASGEMVIHSQQEFDQVFGDATLMGEAGESTPIDFDKQFVIALVLNQTDFATHVQPLDLRPDNHENLKLRYAVQVGEREQHVLQPTLVLIVNKEYQAPVRFDRVD